MPVEAVSAFVFGKLPAHGDFIARGMDAATQGAWDAWLTQELIAARARHGDAFDARYGAAPVWHFAFDEGAAAVAGGLALSVDAAGRRFPVLAGRAATPAAGVVAAACEECLYDAIAGGWTVDRLFERVSTLDPAPDGDVLEDDAGGEAWWTHGNDGFGAGYLPGARPDGLIARMLEAGVAP